MEEKCRKLKISGKLPEYVQSQNSKSLVVSMEAFSKIKMAAVSHFENSKIIFQSCVNIHVEWLYLVV